MIEFKRILVPLDGSVLAESALSAARTLAQKFESQILLFRGVDTLAAMPALQTEVPARWMAEAREQIFQEAEDYLEAQQGKLREQGYQVQILLRETSPAEGILAAAVTDNVDLIVMSTHGRGGLARWAFGSVADKVVRHSPCPVLLIRQKLEVGDGLANQPDSA